MVLLLVLSTTMHGQFYNYGKFILTEKDKQKHFGAGVVISAIGYEWGLKKFEDRKKAALFGIGLGMLSEFKKNHMIIGEDSLLTLMIEIY